MPMSSALRTPSASFASVGGEAMLGTRETGVRRVFAQGKIEQGGGPFDVALEGQGFFEVQRDGVRAYTRAGSFARRDDGSVANDDGWRLTDVRIPSDATAVHVGADGRVTVDRPHGGGAVRDAFTSSMFKRLRPCGSSVRLCLPQRMISGRARERSVGGDRQPKVRFGMLERSNVNIVEAMMEILTAQRAYEANSKGVQAADEMQRIANNIQRG